MFSKTKSETVWSEVLNYDPETGAVFWRIRPAQRVKIGDSVGRLRKDGYLQFTYCAKTYLLHRVIWDLNFPDNKLTDKEFIDHIDHVRTNNCLYNLRKVTRIENMRNQSLRTNNCSGVTGVYWSSRCNKWWAEICIDYKTTNLGYFKTFQEAVAARKIAEFDYGFHCNHGKESAL